MHQKFPAIRRTAAAALCALAAGALFAADVQTGTVVIGSGVSGMKAAITLKEAGSDVIVLEKMAFPGGATNLAAQYFVVVNTREQQAAGKALTPEGFVARWKAMYPDVLEDRFVKQMRQSQRLLDWMNGLGANLTRVVSDYQMGIADGSSLGVMVVRVLSRRVKDLGIEMRLNTAAQELLTENGRITGVRVKNSRGEVYEVKADNVVLATGGFAASQEVISKFAPEWKGLPSTTAKGSTGDGVMMAERLGAQTAFMDVVRLNPSVSTKDGVHSSLSAARLEGGIMVNLEGKRFCDDYFPDYTQMSRWMMEQPEGRAFIVIDDKSMKASKRLQNFRKQGYFVEDATVWGLAQKMGVPEKNLEETLKVYGASARAGKDEAFGRVQNMKTDFTHPPFYAAGVRPGIQVTLGGISTNDDMQVIGPEGKPFENLYAVGEVSFDGTFRASPCFLGLWCLATIFSQPVAQFQNQPDPPLGQGWLADLGDKGSPEMEKSTNFHHAPQYSNLEGRTNVIHGPNSSYQVSVSKGLFDP